MTGRRFPSTGLVTTPTMAHLLGVQASWLRAEAEAGRVPALRAGTCKLARKGQEPEVVPQYLFDPEVVCAVLRKRAATSADD